MSPFSAELCSVSLGLSALGLSLLPMGSFLVLPWPAHLKLSTHKAMLSSSL